MSKDLDHLNACIQTFRDLELIAEPIEPLKSGKEATVLRCRAHPRTERGPLALKIYRSLERRSFKNDALYREGSLLDRIGGGNTRMARALRARSRFGREVQEGTWAGHEWEVLGRLHAADLRVPQPIHQGGGAILMELFACADGTVAPALAHARLDSETASSLFAALCDDVERMLWLDVVHGDLSPYNVLWNGESYCVIDFPQAMDPRFNRSAERLLARDLTTLARFCARFGDVPDPSVVAAEMWQRFELGEPP
jgi:RIO kinase 1